MEGDGATMTVSETDARNPSMPRISMYIAHLCKAFSPLGTGVRLCRTKEALCKLIKMLSHYVINTYEKALKMGNFLILCANPSQNTVKKRAFFPFYAHFEPYLCSFIPQYLAVYGQKLHILTWQAWGRSQRWRFTARKRGLKPAF